MLPQFRNHRKDNGVFRIVRRVGFGVNVRRNVRRINFVRRFAAESLRFIQCIGKRRYADADFVFTGIRRDGRIDGFLHHRTENRLRTGFTDAVKMQIEAVDRVRRELLQIRFRAFDEHRLAFGRRPREKNGVLHLSVDLPVQRDTGSGSPFVVENRRSVRHFRLLEIVFGHRTSDFFEEFHEIPLNIKVGVHPAAEGFRSGDFRDVVAGRTETAGDNQYVGAAEPLVNGGTQPRRIVADDGLMIGSEPERREFAGNECGVGVDDIPEKDFRPDAENFTNHK